MNKMKQEFNSLLSQGTKMLHQGKPEEALPYLQRAHQLQPEHIDTGINLSGAYILTKKFKKAVEILEPLSAQNPDHSMLWINLGAAYLGNPVLAQVDDQQRAISAFENALRIDPAANSVAYNIGLIYRDRRDFDEAIYWFDQAIKHNPQDNDARRLLEKMKSE
jgi:tetratricopeptide (TPR) repeat protein